MRTYKKFNKNEFAKVYKMIKEQNPGITDKDVAKLLDIPENNFSRRKLNIHPNINKSSKKIKLIFF